MRGLGGTTCDQLVVWLMMARTRTSPSEANVLGTSEPKC